MASKRVHDLHIRIKDEERQQAEEYGRWLQSELGVDQSFSEAFRALASRGYRAWKAEQRARRKAT